MKKRSFVIITIIVIILIIAITMIPLSRIGKISVVTNFRKPLTNWANSIIVDQEFQNCSIFFYTVNKEKTGAVTIHHPGFYFPFISTYTEQKELGILYSPDGQPKGLTQSLVYADFFLTETDTGWKWEEDPLTGDNSMYLEEIIPGWFYYEWHW